MCTAEYALSKLRPGQRAALERMHDGCVLLARPGAGKTITALAYWRQAHPKQRLVVITTPVKRDSLEWEGDAAKLGIVLSEEGEVESWNNIAKYRKYEGCFFVFDEQKASGNGKWARAFVTIAKKNDWIMLSATPGDAWVDWAPLFIANGFYKNRTHFNDSHIVWDAHATYPRIKRYFNTSRLDACRARVCVYMEVERVGTRRTEDVVVGYDKELYDETTKRKWHPYKQEPLANAGALCSVQRQIVNRSSARVETAKELMGRHPRMIVFYTFNSELELLREAAESIGRTVYERNGEVHDPVPDTEGSWVYLVQYLSADAWNCISTNVCLFYSLPYSWRQLEQAYGRIDRMNQVTSDLLYYRLLSTASIDTAIDKVLARKGTFNVNTYASSQGFKDEQKGPMTK